MAVEIQELNPLNAAGWDELVGSMAQASIFHTSAWARVLAETYGYRPLSLVARESGAVRAVLAVMEVRSPVTGRRGVSLPFTDFCPGLGNDASALGALHEHVLQRGRDAGWKYVEWRGEKSPQDGAAPSVSYWHHVADLSPDENVTLGRLKSSVRTAIRKAIGAGVEAEVSTSLDAVWQFCALNDVTRRRHGLPPQPRAFFRNLHRHLVTAGNGFIVVARFEGRPVAASIYLRHARHAVYKYGASDLRHQHLRANDLVMWEALRWFGQQGCTELSMGKTALDNDGLRRFKLGWGVRESEIHYFRFDYRRAGFVQERDAINGWYNRVFRAMPLPLLRMAGRVLYRHQG